MLTTRQVSELTGLPIPVLRARILAGDFKPVKDETGVYRWKSEDVDVARLYAQRHYRRRKTWRGIERFGEGAK